MKEWDEERKKRERDGGWENDSHKTRWQKNRRHGLSKDTAVRYIILSTSLSSSTQKETTVINISSVSSSLIYGNGRKRVKTKKIKEYTWVKINVGQAGGNKTGIFSSYTFQCNNVDITYCVVLQLPLFKERKNSDVVATLVCLDSKKQKEH